MSNNKDDQRPNIAKVTEDGPMMRSVAFMGAQPMHNFQRSSVESHKPFLLQNESKLKSLKLEVDTARVSQSVTSCPWKVMKALAIPSNYQFDRSHTRLANLSSLVVSERIAEHFQKESIAATYDSDQALASGSTENCLKFNVRLWDANDAIVVEVQRGAGCSIDFHHMAKNILRVAKFGLSAATKPRQMPPLPRSLPPLPNEVWESSTNEALEIAANALKETSRADSHALVVESLSQLSNDDRCRLFCAKSILSAESQVLPTLVSLIQRPSHMDYPLHEDIPKGLEDCYQYMHRCAVNTLANCLESLQKTEELNGKLVETLPFLSSDETLSALVHNVAAAETRPHDAAASCRCLNLLCSCHEDTKQYILELDALRHLYAASKCIDRKSVV